MHASPAYLTDFLLWPWQAKGAVAMRIAPKQGASGALGLAPNALDQRFGRERLLRP